MSRILTTTFVFLIFLSLIPSCNFAPGSYPNAEVYEFNLNEDELINTIKQVKQENPEIDLTIEVRIPNGGTAHLPDERKDHWYTFYFYYPDKNEIIKTWTRSTFEGTSQFAFVSTNQGLTLGNWKNPSSETIGEFEHRILAKIKEKLE